MSIKKTELFIEDKQIDLFGDEAFVLNFNVADISDISAKVASYSKELNIPATKENNKIFSHLFDVNSEGYFNPISKKTTELFIDGVCVMRGYFKLNRITIIDNEYVTYHGLIYEDSVNFVQSLGDLELDNLYIPLTGSTAVTTGVTGTITFEDYTGTDSIFRPPITGGPSPRPAGRIHNANATNLVFTGGVFGSLLAIPKDVFPGGYWNGISSSISNYSNPNINAFVASVPMNITVTSNLQLVSPGRGIRLAWIKAIQTSPGVWTHTYLAGFLGVIGAPVSWTGFLNAGEALYFTIIDQGFINSTTPIPLPLVAGRTSTGTISVASSVAVDNLLIDENYVLNNVMVATGSSNDICFPLVDYNQTYPYSATNTRLDNLSETLDSEIRVNFDDLRPAVFVKRVWDEIFKQSGFKYKSKFLDTNANMFKKLCIIGGLEEDEIATLQFERTLTGATGSFYLLEEPLQDRDISSGGVLTGYNYRAFLLGGANTSIWSGNINRFNYLEMLGNTHTYSLKSNPTNGYSGGNYGYVLKALVSGKYKVEAQFDALSLPVQYGAGFAPALRQGLIYFLKIEVLKNGSYSNNRTLWTVPSKSKWVEKKVITFKRERNLNDQALTLTLNETIDLEKGDIARVVLYASAEAQNDPNSTDATAYKSVTRVNHGTTYVRYYRCGTWMGYRATNLTNMLPKGMKQRDFILGISKMFNLYFEPDKQDPKTIFIEPRDTYYEDGTVLNWEKKLDYTKNIDINILSHDQAKNFIFKYKDDSKDYYTEQFKKFTPTELTFGSYEFTSPNEYTSSSDELELPFSASYLQKISGTDPAFMVTGLTNSAMVITKIIDPESVKPSYNGDPSSWKKTPRILYYGGKINLPDVAYRNYSLYFVTYASDGTETEVAMNYYPYAGHYDKPLEPTLDINFYTDTHYLPTTYWNNVNGNKIATNSFTTVNLSTLTIGGNLILTLGSPAAYYNLNSAVDKYLKVSFNNSNYFIGKIRAYTTSGTISVALTITEIMGTGTYSAWNVLLSDVVLKNNLYTTFYKQQMIELTDQSARLMTCYMNLSPVDIANFRFNDIIYAHKEYWRVIKIIDYDTSSDVNQTTKVELLKILRAQTNTLIDYIQGGYLGTFGGTGSGTGTGGGGSTTTGTTPALMGLRNGQPILLTRTTLDTINLAKNSILLDDTGQVPTSFGAEVVLKTGVNDIYNTINTHQNSIGALLELVTNTPIGDTITLTNGDTDAQTLADGVKQVYFDTTDRTKLFQITLPTTTTDGYTINFNVLANNNIAFMQFTNDNVTNDEISVIDSENSITAVYNASLNIWNIITR